MLSQPIRYRMFLLFKSISENEAIVEEQRQQLAKQHGFEPWAAFKRLDRMGLGKISAYDINTFLRENMVDYISEVECFHMFNYFDRDNDGFLDFQDFLVLVLPCNDITLRAKVSQRPNFEVGKDERMQSNVEFELSRLLEKEIHYHVKVEIEKKELESMDEFCTVALFSVLDPHNYGYLDFDQIKNFYCRFKKTEDVVKEDINAILRRMNDDSDARITFREYCLAITPTLAGLTPDAAQLEFNVEAKKQLEEAKKLHETQKVTKALKSNEKVQPVRAFKSINANEGSPVRQEFKDLRLRTRMDPDLDYVLDTVKMGSPQKYKTRDFVAQKLGSLQDSPIIHNRVRNYDERFDQNWEQTMHGVPLDAREIEISNKTGKIGSQAHTRKPASSSHQSTHNDCARGPSSRSRSPNLDKPSETANSQRRTSHPRTAEVNNNLKQNERTTVKDLLVTIAHNEMQTEKLRQRLVRECEEFNTVDAFRLIDLGGRGEIDCHELKMAIQRDIRAQFIDLDIELFFKRFDKEQRGTLKYSEFCDAFVPKSQTVLSELTQRVPRNIKMEMNYHECFTETTRTLYRSLWEQLFKSEAQVESQRQDLLKNPTFDIQRAFKLFDPSAKEVHGEFLGSIKRDALGTVLELEGPYRDILFARFNKRMQVDSISYSEFIEEVTPRGPLLF